MHYSTAAPRFQIAAEVLLTNPGAVIDAIQAEIHENGVIGGLWNLTGGELVACASDLISRDSTAAERGSATTCVLGTLLGAKKAADTVMSAANRVDNAIPTNGRIALENGLESDLALAREHLAGLGPEVLGDPANQGMLSSIDNALATGRPLTSTELNFIRHELTEAELFAEGVPHTYGEMFDPSGERPPYSSHDTAWTVDGMKPGSNYFDWLFDDDYFRWMTEN